MDSHLKKCVLLAILVVIYEGFQRVSADERTDCEVQADYALYVAQERDKGTPMSDLLGRQKGSAPEQVWARMTVSNIYGNQLVTAQRVKELYMVRCNP